jgi:toxin-antitoxin system PIN domain toxin
MQVVDANVLLYAINQDTAHHDRARGWLDSALNGEEAVGFTWVVLLAFLRLATRPGLFPRPLDVATATATVELWLAQPPAVVLQPTQRHGALLRSLLEAVGSAGNLVNDAHLAALAVEHGGRVVSFDADFARFPGVRSELPGAD